MKTINVNISTLKARLSEYLRLVREGTKIIVMDHSHPVAEVTPSQAISPQIFVSTPPSETPKLNGLFPPCSNKKSFSSTEILLEDRKKR